MSMRLYDTLTRNVLTIEPREPGRLAIYCCGPTVYDVPHAGHARAALAPDVLVRHLREEGLEITYARNITDVDDKILKRAKENGESPLELSHRMAQVYQEEMRLLGCLDPTHEPRVSQHIEQIIALVTALIEKGNAYTVDMGEGLIDVYFAVRSFPGYGKLSRRKIDDLRAGARVEADDRKKDPLDFALWKGAPADEWGWDSPWGRGRPGWHIECSAMSTEYLGHGFDIHAGGMDLIFPHHENEIAQSEAAVPETGPMARAWMHNGFVNVDKEKMGKSLGNFVTVRDVLARNDPEGFRWFLLTVHYRGPIQFETEKLASGRVIFPGIDEAERRVDYIYSTQARLEELASGDPRGAKSPPPELEKLGAAMFKAEANAVSALSDDLNTPVALAALGELARLANELGDLAHKRRKDRAFAAATSVLAAQALKSLRSLCKRLGLLLSSPGEYQSRCRERRLSLRNLKAEAVEAKVQERIEARKSRDFGRADAIRTELTELGVQLRDNPEGTEWTVDV